MKTDNYFLKEIVSEFDRILPFLNDPEVDIQKKFYYFSALHGIINRSLNFEYNPKLLFIHNILANAHTAFASRIDNMISGKERGIVLPKEILGMLFSAVEELRNRLSNEKDVFDVLEKISILSYITTGNGCYLFEKGHIKL